MKILTLISLGFIIISCANFNRFSKLNNRKVGVWIETPMVDSVKFQLDFYKGSGRLEKSKIYYSDNSILIGRYKESLMHGPWRYSDSKKNLLRIDHYTDGFLSRIEYFENDKLVKQIITDPRF